MTTSLDRFQKDQRWQEIPAPIRNVAERNALVSSMLSRYAAGQIITKEEALCQIIVGLATDWDHMRQAYEDCQLMNPGPIIVPRKGGPLGAGEPDRPGIGRTAT